MLKNIKISEVKINLRTDRLGDNKEETDRKGKIDVRLAQPLKGENWYKSDEVNATVNLGSVAVYALFKWIYNVNKIQ